MFPRQDISAKHVKIPTLSHLQKNEDPSVECGDSYSARGVYASYIYFHYTF
jgi:hypothetical protein